MVNVQLIYRVFRPDGTMQLFEFTVIFGIVMMVLSQLPSFHSLRYINLVSLLCSLGYSFCAVGGCIYAGGLSLHPQCLETDHALEEHFQDQRGSGRGL